mmetsp:Transcript_12722/g.19757  ORF Transcript_12722/g.19757 Transcript_12722/m.19757 type:complete len:288 (-) Transcript_12722:376-1239(-)
MKHAGHRCIEMPKLLDILYAVLGLQLGPVCHKNLASFPDEHTPTVGHVLKLLHHQTVVLQEGTQPLFSEGDARRHRDIVLQALLVLRAQLGVIRQEVILDHEVTAIHQNLRTPFEQVLLVGNVEEGELRRHALELPLQLHVIHVHVGEIPLDDVKALLWDLQKAVHDLTDLDQLVQVLDGRDLHSILLLHVARWPTHPGADVDGPGVLHGLEVCGVATEEIVHAFIPQIVKLVHKPEIRGLEGAAARVGDGDRLVQRVPHPRVGVQLHLPQLRARQRVDLLVALGGP